MGYVSSSSGSVLCIHEPAGRLAGVGVSSRIWMGRVVGREESTRAEIDKVEIGKGILCDSLIHLPHKLVYICFCTWIKWETICPACIFILLSHLLCSAPKNARIFNGGGIMLPRLPTTTNLKGTDEFDRIRPK